MREAVSDILIDRSREVAGVNRMILVSLVAHAALLAALALMPASWRSGSHQVKTTPMMISLGGSPGPDAGGMTQLSNRPVQAVAPPDVKPMPQVPPAMKAPEMVVPDASKAAPKNAAVKAPDKSASRKVTTGPQVKSGAARVETPGAAQVPFGGLSTSSSAGTGGVKLDVDFCCPSYITTMVQRIRENWKENQGAAGGATIKYIIRRDGMITNVEVEKSSNNPILDLESRRAVLMTRQLPPLPREFTQPTLTVHLEFEYKR
jgi:TonB family protein